MSKLALRCAFAFAALLGGVACQSEEIQNLGGQKCTYKQVIPCQTDACSGTQICLPDLSGFSACTCLDAGATD